MFALSRERHDARGGLDCAAQGPRAGQGGVTTRDGGPDHSGVLLTTYAVVAPSLASLIGPRPCEQQYPASSSSPYRLDTGTADVAHPRSAATAFDGGLARGGAVSEGTAVGSMSVWPSSSRGRCSTCRCLSLDRPRCRCVAMAPPDGREAYIAIRGAAAGLPVAASTHSVTRYRSRLVASECLLSTYYSQNDIASGRSGAASSRQPRISLADRTAGVTNQGEARHQRSCRRAAGTLPRGAWQRSRPAGQPSRERVACGEGGLAVVRPPLSTDRRCPAGGRGGARALLG